MNIKRSQRAFVGVTLTTVVGIAMILIVYAATLANIQGGEVTVGAGNLTGSITYSTDNLAGWGSTLGLPGINDDWYAKFVTTGGQYVGPVSIIWQLQQKQTDGTWTDMGSSTTTAIALTSASQTIYATIDGSGPTGNRDWSLTATATTSYRVTVNVQTTG